MLPNSNEIALDPRERLTDDQTNVSAADDQQTADSIEVGNEEISDDRNFTDADLSDDDE